MACIYYAFALQHISKQQLFGFESLNQSLRRNRHKNIFTLLYHGVPSIHHQDYGVQNSMVYHLSIAYHMATTKVLLKSTPTVGSTSSS